MSELVSVVVALVVVLTITGAVHLMAWKRSERQRRAAERSNQIALLQSEVATLEGFLANMSPERFLERKSFEHRLNKTRRELATALEKSA